MDHSEFRTKIRVEVATLVVLLLTLVVVATYTGITGYQAHIARDTAQRQLRAYVGVGDPKIDEKGPNQITFPVHNGGQTPAYNVRSHLNWVALPSGLSLPKDFDFADTNGEPSSQNSAAYLNPGQDRIFLSLIDDVSLARARRGEVDLYIYGHVEYQDIYKVSRKTTFAYQYIGQNEEDGVTHHRLLLLNRHNDAD